MKKSIAVLFTVLVLSFRTYDEKKYTVSLTLAEWNLVLEVIENSNSPHSQVKVVQQLLIPGLQKQIADTLKKK